MPIHLILNFLGNKKRNVRYVRENKNLQNASGRCGTHAAAKNVMIWTEF